MSSFASHYQAILRPCWWTSIRCSCGLASAEMAIEQTINKYFAKLLGELKSTSTAVTSCPVVLLAGSSGNLGLFVLETLVKDMSIARVYV